MKYPNLELLEFITESIACEIYNCCLNGSESYKFKMYVFPQTWGSTMLGFDKYGGCAGQAFTEAYTTVVEMTWNDFYTRNKSDNKIYAVFFDGRIAYICLNPSHEFFVDINNMNMKSQREAIKYYEDDKYSKNSRVSIL